MDNHNILMYITKDKEGYGGSEFGAGKRLGKKLREMGTLSVSGFLSFSYNSGGD